MATVGLYGSSYPYGGTYFEWFIFQQSATAPATPTGGSWNFITNTGTAPTGWSTTPPASPTQIVWASIAIVSSIAGSTITWTTPATWVQPGTPGTSGYSGYSGYSGFSGANGASGISGYSGANGASGISGYSGSGVSGYSGYSGFSGAGSSGYSGYSGISGYSGAQGASGYSGISGFSGPSGYSGSGISGYSGFSGFSGAPGSGAGTVTSVAMTVPSFMSVTGSPVTSSGTLAVSATTSGANSIVLRDTNQNISANSITEGFSSVAASGTTTTLTVASVPNYVVTGSGGQTFKLPDATTLANGVNYVFNNNQSSGTIVVQNNATTTITTIQSGGFVEVILLSNATSAGSWDVHTFAPSNVSWSTNTLDYPGSITSATWNGTAVAINRGGTGLSSVGTSGYALVSNGSALTYTAFPTGISGYSGYSGYSGISGTNGTSGYSGYSGISGYSGYSGTAGPTVYPGAGIPNSTGSAWGTSYTTSGSGTVVALNNTPTLTNPTVTNYVETLQAVGTVGSTSTLSLTSGTVLTATLTASTPCTFTMPTATAGKSFILKLTQASSGMTTATFTSVKWAGGTAPTITATASAVDIISFVSDGTNWYGTYAQAFA
jgi:hypothetical protein